MVVQKMDFNKVIKYFLVNGGIKAFSSQHVYIKDKSLNYLSCNQPLADLLKFSTPNQIVGKSDYDLMESQLAKSVHYVDQKILLSGKTHAIKEIGFDHDGDYTIYQSYKMPFYKGNEPAGIIGFSYDTKMKIEEKNYSVILSLTGDLYGFGLYLLAYFNSVKLALREIECLFYLVNGLTTKEIAKEMNVSPCTVETYLNNAKLKFECKNRVDLLAKVLSCEKFFL